jgi:hypothetical protein
MIHIRTPPFHKKTPNPLFSLVESILESHLDAVHPEVCANTKPRLSSTQLILHDFWHFDVFQETAIFYEVIDNMCLMPVTAAHATPQPI